MKQSKSLTVGLSVFTALFILSVSIAVPILFRPFYYMQIEPLGLVENTEWTREEIITAYDEMLDFCTGIDSEFSTGVLEWSQSGKSHFVDVRGLFILDFAVAIISSVVLLSWQLLKNKSNITPYRFFKRGYGFWGSVTLVSLFVIIGSLVAVDFNRAFNVFHAIFFPGKDNWIFDYDTDQIIWILPEVFFRNCAILILVFIVLLCVTFTLADLLGVKNDNEKNEK